MMPSVTLHAARGGGVLIGEIDGPPRLPRSRRAVAVRLVGLGVLLYLGLVAVGLTITRLQAADVVVHEDSRLAQWFAENRTATLNTATHWGTTLSDTSTAIALSVVAVIAFRWWLRRWLESGVVLAAILGELFVFLLVTNTIDRNRPPVPHLDPAPPTSSFPSGHTAAAIALYGCIAILLLYNLSAYGPVARRAARVVAVLCFCVPFVVATCRMYRGMHYASDVTFGLIGGGLWLLIVLATTYPRRMRALSRPGRSRSSAAEEV